MSTTRSRAPLASIPNATNSPHRALTQSIGKRSRQYGASLQGDELPAKKKLLLEVPGRQEGANTPGRPLPSHITEARVLGRERANRGVTDFHKKLIASRREVARPEPDHSESSLRSWHKHYRKVFPSFVFYFDNVPSETHVRFSKCLGSFGAREERFFSRSVTHIVTTRPIPPESPIPNTSSKGSTSRAERNAEEPPRTINPSLLDKKSTGPSQLYTSKCQPGAATRRDPAPATDVLSRGRQMGMRIWALEKLHRIMTSMLEYDDAHGQSALANVKNAGTLRTRDEDLSHTLRKEKQHGSLDRDLATSMKEVVVFKGPFIYIHDLDCKTRPIMVREYPKVEKKADGIWPQFRSAAVGKCPFIEEPSIKKEREAEREREQAARLAQHQRQTFQPKLVTVGQRAVPTYVRRSPRKALKEVQNPPAPIPAFKDAVPKMRTFEPPKALPQMACPSKQELSAGFVRPQALSLTREPAASGIQRSNLTSAIRSQMISSTAAAPGTKAGTSKEVNELKRKVLERTHTGSLSVGSIPSSHRMTDLAGALKNARAAPQRAAKSKAQEKLGGVMEEAGVNNSDDELGQPRMAPSAPLKKKRAAVKNDPKPGYCENCRDKYDDFEDHTTTRKHRKFAFNPTNWGDLDCLLRTLQAEAVQQEQVQQQRER